MAKKQVEGEQSTSLLQNKGKGSSSSTRTKKSMNDNNSSGGMAYEMIDYAHGHQPIKGTSDDDDGNDSDNNDDDDDHHHDINDDRPPEYEEEESREPLKYKRRKRRLRIFAVIFIIFLIFSVLCRVALTRLFKSFVDSIDTADIDENEGDIDIDRGNDTGGDSSTVDANNDAATYKNPGSPYTQILSLSESLVPTKSGKYKDRRLVFIGDVHGCVDELKVLVDKVHSKHLKSHIVLAGDLVTKGPKSVEVLDLAIKLKASCVRGNNDDKVMLAYHHIQQRRKERNSNGETRHEDSDSDSDNGDFSDEDDTYEEQIEESESELISKRKKKKKPFGKSDQRIARKMKPHHAKYLDSCPLMLTAHLPHIGDIITVHAGILPGLHLLKQDPYTLMNMRTIDPVTHQPSASRDGGEHWAKLWNKEQEKQYKKEGYGGEEKDGVGHMMTTVIYGHDARRGLEIKRFTRGLDSNCVRGGKLTALVLDGGGKDGVSERIVSVECKKWYN